MIENTIKAVQPYYWSSEFSNLQVCCFCGRGVFWGSGMFANRVPECNSIEERREDNRIFPLGDWICNECESNNCDVEEP